MFLFDIELHVFVRLVEFARSRGRLKFANHLLEKFQRFETAFAFVTFDVQFHAPVGSNRGFKFALRHKFVEPLNR